MLSSKSDDGKAPVADAAVTRERGVVCGVLTADCLPVAFADRRGKAVGVAHAGWRGLRAGVLEATIAALRGLGSGPDDLVAWLGPAIGPSRFEVGADVRDPFCARIATTRPGSCHTARASGSPISTGSRAPASSAAAWSA
jgi:YfiH family protein